MTTPRPYLSWSQYNTFGRSPKSYKKIYLLGERFQTERMRFGKEMAQIRESGETVEGMEHIQMFLPEYPRREYEITVTIKIDGKPVVLLGRMDGVDLRRHIIGDDKAAIKWTQKDTDKSEQLTWYSFLYWKKKGIIPKLEINWIEMDPDKVEATGKVQTFKTIRTVRDFILLNAKINERWRGIVELCSKEWAKVL